MFKGADGKMVGLKNTGSLIERREPASHPASLVCTGCRVPRPRPPPVLGTHAMGIRPSSVPLRVPLPPPPKSSLPVAPDPKSDLARAAKPTVSHLLATVVTDPSFESTAASALVAELVDFAVACRLEYTTSLVAESSEFESAGPPSVGGQCSLGTDVLEDTQKDFECLAAAVPCFPSMLLAPEGDPDAPDIPTPRSYTEAITRPYSSQWQAAMDADMASWKSTSTYVDAVPPQQQGVDYFHTFSPTRKMTTLRVLLHVVAQRDYVLHSLDFSTAFLQGSLHEEIWLRRTPGFIGSFRAGTEWSLRRPVYGLCQAPREWHDTLWTTLAALGLAPSTADPYLGLQIPRDRARRTIILTQSHMVHQVLQRFGFQFSSPQPTPLSTSHSLSAPPSDKTVEPSDPYPELVGCLMYLMTCTRPDLTYPLSLLARYVAPGRHRKVHWDAAKRVHRYLCSTSGMELVLGGRGPVVLTGHADNSWSVFSSASGSARFSDRGGDFSSDLLQEFCRREGILQSFILPASPQQNGVAERRIGLVMECARTSMIHAAAPHFLWPFWVFDALVFHSGALMPLFEILLQTSSPPAPFPTSSLAFPLTRMAGSFTTPPRVVYSPLRTSRLTSRFPLPPPPPWPLFIAPGPHLVDRLPPQGPAPSVVSQVDPLPMAVPVEVAVDLGAARGVASGGAALGVAASRGAEPKGAVPKGAEPGGAESEGAESEGESRDAEPEGAEPGVTEPEGAELGGAESEGAESEGDEPRGTTSFPVSA
ncbi:unnamed protein product [Closterium sp. NIES-54]